MGGFTLILFILRFFVFHLYESPKYLMGRGRDKEAVEVVHLVAKYNGTTSSLTLESLQEAGAAAAGRWSGEDASVVVEMDTSAIGAVRRRLTKLNLAHVKPLFATRKLAYSTSLLILSWGASIIYNYSIHRINSRSQP